MGGINSAKFAKASGIAFAIPAKQVKVALDALYSKREFIEPELGITTSVGTEKLNEYLTGIKSKGGVYVKDIMPKGLYAQAGGKAGDLLLAIDNHKVDRFGKVWMDKLKDRLSTAGLLLRHPIGQDVTFHVYRTSSGATRFTGRRLLKTASNSSEADKHAVNHAVIHAIDLIKTTTSPTPKGSLVKLRTAYQLTERPKVHFMYEPIVERPKFVTFGGFVFVKLNLNLVETHMDDNPEEMVKYMLPENRDDSAIIISNIVPASLAHDDGSAKKGLLVHKINDMDVKTFPQLCSALSARTTPTDFWTLTTSKTFTSFSVKQVLEYEKERASDAQHTSAFNGCNNPEAEEVLKSMFRN